MAIIPARGGSKGIPGKNLARVGGIPLVTRAISTARAVPVVDAVYVSTDDEQIAAEARRAGAQVIARPPELSSDEASSEAALIHAIESLRGRGERVDVVAFLQATSPFIFTGDLAQAVAAVTENRADSVFSAFATYAFLWRREGGSATGVNHDHRSRPRRQDREAHFQETGAFYVMNADGFLDRGFRFFGRVAIQEVDETWAIEVDDPEQLEAARRAAPHFRDPSAVPGLAGIQAIVTDFDGVHTDDTAIVDENGLEAAVVSRSDGMGVGLLRNAGIPMLILSKEVKPIVAMRAAKLGVEARHSIDDKAPVLQAWAAEHGVDLGSTVYIGNDINDIPCLELVGWPVVVADAHPAVLPHARLVLQRPGGRGAVRELIDLVLRERECAAPVSSDA